MIDQDGQSRPTRAPLDPATMSALVRGALYPAAIWSGSQTRFTWMNESFQHLLQTSRRDVLGLPLTGFLSDELPATLLLDAAYTGSPHVVPDYERLDDDGPSYWHIVLLPTLQGVGPYDVLVIAREVTPQAITKHAAARERDLLLGSLSLIGTTILTSSDADEMLQRAIVEAVEAFDADWGWIAERDGERWRFRTTHGLECAPSGLSFTEDEGSLPRLALQAGKVVCASRTNAHVEHVQLLDRHELDAFMLVPVFEHGLVTAVLGFCWGSPVAITEDHRRVAEQLAVSLSLALANVHDLDSQRELGQRFSSTFFTVPKQVPGFEIAHLYRSASFGARVGGDFFDVVDVGGGRVGIIMGDIAGHGLEAAPMASTMKGLLRAEMSLQVPPSALVRRANELVLRDSTSGGYASAFVGTIDRHANHLRYCCAGHPAPLLVRNDEVEYLDQRQVILGVDESTRYRETRAVITEGDLLVLYTDGLTDARDALGEAFGNDRLLATMRGLKGAPVDEIPQALFMAAFSHAEGELRDDVAVLAVRLLAA